MYDCTWADQRRKSAAQCRPDPIVYPWTKVWGYNDKWLNENSRVFSSYIYVMALRSEPNHVALYYSFNDYNYYS